MALKHWIAVGALSVAAAGFVLLGRWQLDRAEVNRAIEHGFADAANLPVLREPVAADRIDALRYRRIELAGHYRPDVQILLDNMTLNGRPGYEVITPFVIGPGPWVLVNRGWIAAAADRSVLPEISLPDATSPPDAASPPGAVSRAPSTSVAARLDHLPRAALRLDAAPAGNGSAVVLSFPDGAAIEAALGHAIYPYQLLLDPNAPEGLVREWGPEVGRADRNIAYAVQWFGLAALALVLGVGVAWRAGRGSRSVTS
jgi:surfeit locus 1 family protein